MLGSAERLRRRELLLRSQEERGYLGQPTGAMAHCSRKSTEISERLDDVNLYDAFRVYKYKATCYVLP